MCKLVALLVAYNLQMLSSLTFGKTSMLLLRQPQVLLNIATKPLHPFLPSSSAPFKTSCRLKWQHSNAILFYMETNNLIRPAFSMQNWIIACVGLLNSQQQQFCKFSPTILQSYFTTPLVADFLKQPLFHCQRLPCLAPCVSNFAIILLLFMTTAIGVSMPQWMGGGSIWTVEQILVYFIMSWYVWHRTKGNRIGAETHAILHECSMIMQHVCGFLGTEFVFTFC